MDNVLKKAFGQFVEITLQSELVNPDRAGVGIKTYRDSTNLNDSIFFLNIKVRN